MSKMPVTASAHDCRAVSHSAHALKNIEERMSLEAALRLDIEKIEASLTATPV